MAYLSLYRKYRPHHFSEVVGQRHVTQTLANAVRQGRIAHAYLFTGPRGTGKTSTARVLAMALNCERREAEPCGECEPCRRIISGSALDVIEIDAASNRSVDDMRDLVDRVALVPAEARFKVYIVDEVHMLTPESFNTFLKTLEEPPPHVIFVLATTEAHKVLPTIMSRCQRFDFRRLSIADIAGELRRVADAEAVEVEDRAITMLAHAADGAMRDAITMLEQAIAYSQERVTADTVVEILGGVDFDLFSEFATAFTARDTARAFALIDRVMVSGKDLKQLVVGLIGHYRDLLLLSLDRRGADALALPEELIQRAAEQARALSPDEAVRVLDLLAETDRELRLTSQPRLLVELMAVRVCAAPEPSAAAARRPAPAVPAVRREPETKPRATPSPAQAAARAEEAPAPSSARATAPPAESKPVTVAEPVAAGEATETLAEIRRRWEDVIGLLNQATATRSLAGFLRDATPTALADGLLTLTFRLQFHHGQMATSEERRKTLSEAIAQVTGATVLIRCEMGEARAPRGEARPQPKLIQDVLSTFPGSTVEEEE